ncbi:hypothetical protein [Rhodoferax ferrireducens]|uniref:hypothetical protein n=1 Tax=Rhodoferax ferrireducens TaxID=192843 RepID=UPI000E0D7424|nr:hypothetical protein [Rhodoferax ferrireducens]
MTKEVSQKSPAEPQRSNIHLYSVNDPIPVPEAIESDSDAAWALWEDSLLPPSTESDADFKSTIPAEFPLFLFDDSPKRNL